MKLQSHIRLAIDCVRDGSIGAALAETFFPNEVPVPKEHSLWDYKQTLDLEKAAYAELAKDVISFFNSYGGYLFIGVSETSKDEQYSVTGFDRPKDFVANVRGAIDSYSSARIDVAISDLNISGRPVTAIYIPRRPASQSPVFLTKNGPEKKNGRLLFTEKTTYFRQLDQTLSATMSLQWEFLYSERNPNDLIASEIALSPAPSLSRVIPNNLPDRSLICPHLFGREDVLASLWAWIGDELEPVRLLAGAGGKGKTSIAYEFASRFFRNAPMPFVQVLWVSAKRQQFRADRNEYMELPEYWYANPRELLVSLCVGTAALSQEEQASNDESEYTLQKKLRESLRLLPSFILIDDIDSLQQKEQKRVFELVQQVSAGAPSKFLLTTRANFAFSDTQCIQISGLAGEPYHALVADRLTRYQLPRLKAAEVSALRVASDGSPLWTDSILRLMRQGHSLQQAIGEWKGRPGEDARAAALKKELVALSQGARRMLLAAAMLGESSRAELLEVTKVGRIEFDEAITELQTLFLVEAPKIIKQEPRFSVLDSTAIAVREFAAELVPEYRRIVTAARDFSKRTLAAAGNSSKKRIGAVINQAIALMSTGNKARAIQTVDAALGSDPDNPDLLLLRGRCLRESNPGEAVSAFNSAYRLGQRKPLLFDMWYQALSTQGMHAAALDVAKMAIEEGYNGSTWYALRARSLVQIALARSRDGNTHAAVDLLQMASADMWAAIAAHGGARQAEQFRSDVYAVNDAAWKIASEGTGLEAELLAFDTVRHALEGGDHRIKNVDRLLTATGKLIADLELSSDSNQARAGRTRVTDASRALQSVRRLEDLPASAHAHYDRAIEILEGHLR